GGVAAWRAGSEGSTEGALENSAESFVLPLDGCNGIRRRDIVHHRNALPLPKAFVAAEEKCAISLDRSAQRSAKIILRERRRDGPTVPLERRIQIEEAPRIEGAIPQEVKQRSMQLVAA